jgi:DNA-directed RNA polymerases I and III subunit RPAC2
VHNVFFFSTHESSLNKKQKMAMIEPFQEDQNGMPVYSPYSTLTPSIQISTQSTQSSSSQTFIIKNEDHTLGNALRYMIMKNEQVEFCGYSIPHPSDGFIQLRIQTDGNMTAKEALKKGLQDLKEVAGHVRKEFKNATSGVSVLH